MVLCVPNQRLHPLQAMDHRSTQHARPLLGSLSMAVMDLQNRIAPKEGPGHRLRVVVKRNEPKSGERTVGLDHHKGTTEVLIHLANIAKSRTRIRCLFLAGGIVPKTPMQLLLDHVEGATNPHHLVEPRVKCSSLPKARDFPTIRLKIQITGDSISRQSQCLHQALAVRQLACSTHS